LTVDSEQSTVNIIPVLPEMISVIYAIKLELKLNNKECSLMARHSGYALGG
jgi:hypothetical protein